MFMLLLVRGAQVLLERRPPAGIWGGMISVPECEPMSRTDLTDHVAQRFGLGVVRAHAYEPFRHAFTHYRLIANPVVLEVEGPGAQAREDNRQWVRISEAQSQALPAPVRALLMRLALTLEGRNRV